jgi:hypothetical protein
VSGITFAQAALRDACLIQSSERMLAVSDLVIQLIVALFQCAAELLCHFSSKVLLPVLTGGRVTVMPYAGFGTSRWFIPCRRLSNGRIGVEGDFAVLIALIFWVVVIVSITLVLHRVG